MSSLFFITADLKKNYSCKRKGICCFRPAVCSQSYRASSVL